MRRMLDCFSGRHGASQAFHFHKDWEVITIDNHEDLESTYKWDLSKPETLEKIQELGLFNLVWLSPPCIEFAQIRLPWINKSGEPDMTLVHQAIAIVELLQPECWVIENTKSGSHFIKPILGEPRLIAGPYYLWGRFPKFDPRLLRDYKKPDTSGRDPMRSNFRATVPREISEGLLDAIENQQTLEGYF